MDHKLLASPSSVSWGILGAAIAPVLHIQSGDVVEVETVSGGPRNLPPIQSRYQVLHEHVAIIRALKSSLGPHILTGPIHIREAEPGDRLIVRILSVDLRQDWGWNAIEPGFGLDPNLADMYRNMTIPIDRVTRTATLPWTLPVSVSPFFGIMAVAPDPAVGIVNFSKRFRLETCLTMNL